MYLSILQLFTDLSSREKLYSFWGDQRMTKKKRIGLQQNFVMTQIQECLKPITISQNPLLLLAYLYTPVTDHSHYNSSFTPTSISHREPLCRLVWKAWWWLPAGKNSSCRLREGNQRDTLTSNKRICEFLSFLRHSGTTQHYRSPPRHHYHNVYTSSENKPTSLQQGYNVATRQIHPWQDVLSPGGVHSAMKLQLYCSGIIIWFQNLILFQRFDLCYWRNKNCVNISVRKYIYWLPTFRH